MGKGTHGAALAPSSASGPSLPASLAPLVDEVRHQPYPGPARISRPLTTSERIAVEKRIAILEDRLRPAEETAEWGGSVTLMMAPYAGDRTEAEHRTSALAFIEALADLPAWAINVACRKWLRGEVETARAAGMAADPTFAPKPQHIRAMALAEVVVIRGELVFLRRLTGAKPIPHLTDAQRAENLRRLNDLLKPRPFPPEEGPLN